MRVINKVKTAVRRARGIDGLTPVPVRDAVGGPYDVKEAWRDRRDRVLRSSGTFGDCKVCGHSVGLHDEQDTQRCITRLYMQGGAKDTLTPVPVRDGDAPFYKGEAVRDATGATATVVEQRGSTVIVVPDRLKSTTENWPASSTKLLFKSNKSSSKPAKSKDTLTPVPVSPGSSGKALAIAKHNAGVTRSQDRRARDGSASSTWQDMKSGEREKVLLQNGISPSQAGMWSGESSWMKLPNHVMAAFAKTHGDPYRWKGATDTSPVRRARDGVGDRVVIEAGWGGKGGRAGQDFKRFSKDTPAVVVAASKIGGNVWVKPDDDPYRWEVPERSFKKGATDTSPVFNLSPVPMPEDEHDRGRLAQPEYPALDALRFGRAKDGEEKQTKYFSATNTYNSTDAHKAAEKFLEEKRKTGYAGYQSTYGAYGFSVTFWKKTQATDALRGLTPVGKAKDGEVNVGEKIHLGFGTRGGAGFEGIVTKIEGDTVYIKNSEGRTFKGPLRFASKAGVEDALTPVPVGDFAPGKAKDGPWDDNVARLTENIKKEVRAQKADGTVSMSKANLKQMVKSGGLHFPNENAFERAFEEALVKAGVGKFVHATDALRGLTPVGV